MELKIGGVVKGMRNKASAGKGWSRAKLANVAGTGRTTKANVHGVRRIEENIGAPSFADAARIAHAFGHSVEVFVPKKHSGGYVAVEDRPIPEPKAKDKKDFPKSPLTFGEKLLYLRKRMRMTQPELSKKSKVPVTTIAKYEGGHTGSVRLSVAIKLAGALGVRLREFEGCADVWTRPLPLVSDPVARKRGRRAKK